MKLLSPSHLVTPLQYTKKGQNFQKISVSTFSKNSKFSKFQNFQIKLQNFKIVKKFQNFKIKKKNKNFNIFQNFKKFKKNSRIFCNKAITTLELDQYEFLWSIVQQY